MFLVEDGVHQTFWSLRYDEVASSDLFYRHMHNNIEIHLITKGEGIFNIEGAETEVSTYDLMIIPPHFYHVFNVNKSYPYERIVFNFPIDYYEIDIGKLSEKPLIVNLSNHLEILESFKKIVEASNTLNANDFEKILHLYVQIILIELKNTAFENGMSKSVNRLTASILSFIDDHIAEPLDVTTIASSLYVSKSHLQNTFYKSMKIGLKTYIIQKKMDAAHIMLNDGMYALEVAKKLGYTTYSTFYKSYMKIYGVPPKGASRK